MRLTALALILLVLPAVLIIVREDDSDRSPLGLTDRTPEELEKIAANELKMKEVRQYQFTVPENPICPYIDAVYMWVNGTDPLVMEQYKQAYGSDYVESGRMRDIPTMKYSIRALLTYAPFIRQVIIVTNGQRPDWLNMSNPRVRVVAQKDIFEHPENLPTFNSNAIEAQLLRIPDLAPCYFALNDDFSFGRPVKLEDWIEMKTGRQYLAFDSWIAPRLEDMKRNIWHHSVAYSNFLINKYYHPEEITPETTVENPTRNYRYEAHNIRLYQQRLMERIYDHFREEFLETTKHRSRTRFDTVLSFIYNNAVLEEFDGIVNANLSRGMMYGTFTNEIPHVEKTLTKFIKRKPIAWCLNDAAGKILTPKDEEAYNNAVAALEKVLTDAFPLPSEVEKVKPGQAVIPRTLREYEIMLGVIRPEGKSSLPTLLAVLWFIAFVYLILTTVALWLRQGTRPMSTIGSAASSIFADSDKDHNV